MKKDVCRQALMNLGFTALEADIYILLVEQSPITGYRIAQVLGKAAANTYKAIETLHNKGAVLVDEGESRLCRAVPYKEVLHRLESSFQKNKNQAEKALASIKNVPADDRIYQIRTVDQVMARCRTMLKNCAEIAIIDIFPQPLEILRPDIEAAVANGVDVSIKIYQEEEIAQANIFLDPMGKSIISKWPGQWINMVIDGNEYLMSFLTEDGNDVHQAIWSGSPYLASVYHSALAAELLMSLMHQRTQEKISANMLYEEIEQYRKRLSPPTIGYKSLMRRFGKPE